ncbi:MAG: hypothetical protein HY544_00975 [Candidatus Diapherotrites archaeon]|uniref:Uncharacterized protein n=1 Tax=Candidatus Iainarchaeum sp. TaxID=3101447 RepID=A0A8T3YJ40_9ARCH|nr:hypothetical protein [Candidatus Diapherotrites archaeon]
MAIAGKIQDVSSYAAGRLARQCRSLGTHAAAAILGAALVAAVYSAQAQRPEVLPQVIGYQPDTPVYSGHVILPLNIGDQPLGDLNAVGFQDGSRTVAHVTLGNSLTLLAIGDPGSNQSLACVYEGVAIPGRPVAGEFSRDGRPQFFGLGGQNNPALEWICLMQAGNIKAVYEKAIVPGR